MIGTKRFSAAIAAQVLLATTAVTARAQTPGFAVDRFDPSERGSDWFAHESIDMRGHLRPAAGLVGEYSYRPLVIYNADNTVRASVVKDSLVLHPGATLVLWDRLRVGFDLPVYAWQDGVTGSLLGTTYTSPSENVGDLRLGADVRIVGVYGDPFTLAAGAQLYVPTGSRRATAAPSTTVACKAAAVRARCPPGPPRARQAGCCSGWASRSASCAASAISEHGRSTPGREPFRASRGTWVG
jgi:hypothetical protein